jgi:hypothetical protein
VAPILLRQENAETLLRSVADPDARQLLEIAYNELQRCFAESGPLPVVDFDALFFVESISRLFGKREPICRILAGEDLAAGYW